MATSTALKLSVYGIVFFASAVLIAGVNQASSDVLFEAAFQGECGEDSPCQHLCFDLHDGTFECACRDGFTLSDNGYSCSENSDLSANSSTKEKRNKANLTYSRSVNGKRILPLPQPLPLVRNSDTRPNGNIRVLEGFEAEGYDDQETELSSKKAGDVAGGGRYLQRETYNNMDNNVKTIQESSRLKTAAEYPLESYVPNFESYDTYDMSDEESEEEFDYDERYQYQPINTISVTTPSTKIRFRSCRDFECESGGVCVVNKKKQGARCRCPLGRRGFFCEYPTEVRYPRFKGTSYLTLPILRDAHKSMQITLEFRPEMHDGILLYSGEKLDLSGDFIAVTLNRGFVECRFDCGMGEGIVKSDQPVVLHSWNYLTVYRDRWDAWMQLNNGKQTQGRSKGLFSRITFRLSLFMGGSPNTTIIRDRLKMDRGFHGCVRLLEINKRLYDFRSGNRGDASDGLDIEECSADVCNRMSCRNGGHCVASSPDQGVCLCPLGFAGSLCENAVDIVVPSFNGSSYFQYSGLGNTVLSFLEVQIVFRPRAPNGLLFYNGYRMDGTGDFFSINLHNGFVELRFDLGTGPAIIRSPEPIEMDEWHNVFVSRTARDAILEVNKQKRAEGISPGAFTQLSLPLNLYIGGVPDLHDVARKAEIKDYFTGCIQKVVVNNRPLKLVQDALSGINIANCEHPCVHSPCHNGGSCETRMDFYICHCLLGSAGTNCEKEVTEMIAEPMFNGFSYLQFVEEDIMKRIRGDKTDIRFRFRSFASEGLLLWTGERLVGPISDYLALSIKDGYLKLQFNLGSGEITLLHNTTKVDDGRWHTVHIIRFEREGTLIVNNSPVATIASPGGLSQLNVNSGLFLGGLRDIGHQTINKFQTGLVGCIANFTLSTDFHVRLVTQAATGVNIQPCV